MRTTRQVAQEILEVVKSTVMDEIKIEKIAAIVQDYNEDVVSEQRIIY